jgi:hypothetical protein
VWWAGRELEGEMRSCGKGERKPMHCKRQTMPEGDKTLRKEKGGLSNDVALQPRPCNELVRSDKETASFLGEEV